jgi:hypothetical protein
MMRKAQILDHWQKIEPNQPIKIDSVAYKHRGSTYTEDGIRLTGSMDFIDSVLSRLTDLLQLENGSTRLQLNYQESKDRKTGVATGTYNCYVQVHERGSEAKMVNAMTGHIMSKGY